METQNCKKTKISLENLPMPIMIKRYLITFKKTREMIEARNRKLSSGPQPQTNSNIRRKMCYIYNLQPNNTNHGLVTTASSEVVARLAKNYTGLAKDRTLGKSQNNSNGFGELAFTFMLGVVGSTVGGHVGASLLPDVGAFCGALVGGPVGVGLGSHILRSWSQKRANIKIEVKEEKPVEHPVPVRPKERRKLLFEAFFSNFYGGQHGFWRSLADL